jgi:D-tyrosyl-tRNA(Tyr) deacylase
MRLVIQRVKQASVTVDNETVGKIGQGLLVLLGIHQDDDGSEIDWLVNKLALLRIFVDEAGKMNLSVQDISGEILVVSQFTLYGNCENGRRPDFIQAARPEKAEELYNRFLDCVRTKMGRVEAGRFGAKMEVDLINDGPVTLIIER